MDIFWYSKLTFDGKRYSPIAVLKLTSNIKFSTKSLNDSQKEHLELLKCESQENNFWVMLNDANLGCVRYCV